jgi:hypothetical protein
MQESETIPNILVLAYNVCAAEELSAKLRRLKLNIESNKNLINTKGYAPKKIEAKNENNKAKIALNFYNDTFLFDQNACSSVPTCHRSGGRAQAVSSSPRPFARRDRSHAQPLAASMARTQQRCGAC